MNIYFSCAVIGGRSDQVVYQELVDHLISSGHTVPTAALASVEVLQGEDNLPAIDVFNRDEGWIRACDAMIAEVSTPSHGVGYEICLALSLNKPVLCCYRSGKSVSKMILGNSSHRIYFAPYDQIGDAVVQIDRFLEENRKK
jgi:nucleoside 2-deoxyribosyltransferase